MCIVCEMYCDRTGWIELYEINCIDDFICVTYSRV